MVLLYILTNDMIGMITTAGSEIWCVIGEYDTTSVNTTSINTTSVDTTEENSQQLDTRVVDTTLAI